MPGAATATPSTCQRDTAISKSHSRHGSPPSGRKLGARQLRDPLACIALAGGIGLAPVAPGTAGSALAVALWWFALAELDPLAQWGIAALAFAAGTLLLERLVRRYRLGDEPAIVLDEVVGCLIALSTAPKAWPWAAATFVLFRLGDIFKPWPIGWADRQVKGGFGIMLDDALAGIAAAAAIGIAQAVL